MCCAAFIPRQLSHGIRLGSRRSKWRNQMKRKKKKRSYLFVWWKGERLLSASTRITNAWSNGVFPVSRKCQRKSETRNLDRFVIWKGLFHLFHDVIGQNSIASKLFFPLGISSPKLFSLVKSEKTRTATFNISNNSISVSKIWFAKMFSFCVAFAQLDGRDGRAFIERRWIVNIFNGSASRTKPSGPAMQSPFCSTRYTTNILRRI